MSDPPPKRRLHPKTMALLDRHLGSRASEPPHPHTAPPQSRPASKTLPSTLHATGGSAHSPKTSSFALTHPPSSFTIPFDDIIIFDTETTGIGPTARLVELAGVRLKHGVIVDTFESLVQPGVKIPSSATHVHGITNSMVSQSPTAKSVLSDFATFTAGRPLMAHNAAFDRSILRQEHARVGLPPSLPMIYCSMKLSRKVFPGLKSYALAALAVALKIPQPQAHRALADCQTTIELFRRCLQRFSSKQLTALHGPGRSL